MKKTRKPINKIILVLVVLIFTIFPLGQLAKLPLGLENISIYLYDPIISAISAILIWDFIKTNQRNYLKNWKKASTENKIVIYFSLAALFSWLIGLKRWGPGNSLPGLLYWLRWTAYAGLFFAAQKLAKTYKSNWQATLNKLIVFSASAAAILGIIQYFLMPNLIFMKYFGWDDHYYRLTAPYFDPGFTGIILAVSILFALKRIKNKNLSFYSLISIQFIALMLTYSRASYLAFAVGIFSLFKKNRFILFAGLMAAVVFILPRPGGEGVKLLRTSTIGARVKNYQQSLSLIKQKPFFGIGFNNLRLLKKGGSHSNGGVDNSFLFTAIVTGAFGLLFFFPLWLAPLRNKSIFPIGLALIVHAQFHNSLFYPWILIWWWTVWGSLVKYDK